MEQETSTSKPQISNLTICETQTVLTLIRPKSIEKDVEMEANGAVETSTILEPPYPTLFHVDQIYHVAATQATPPHPSLASTGRGILEITTSACSSGSAPKSEVLTTTTDYVTRTPDCQSASNPSAICEQEQQRTTLQRQAPYGRSAVTPRRRRRRWNCIGSCIGRNTAISGIENNEEAETEAYGRGPPPAYSSIFAEHSILGISPNRLTSSNSFVAPIPPPSYAQAQGICMASYSMEQLISISPSAGGLWSPRPTAAICPRCTALIVTVTEVRRSALVHVAALFLFLCGCWPCCLIPYCANCCKSTHHYCPVCHTYLGSYTPW